MRRSLACRDPCIYSRIDLMCTPYLTPTPVDFVIETLVRWVGSSSSVGSNALRGKVVTRHFCQPQHSLRSCCVRCENPQGLGKSLYKS